MTPSNEMEQPTTYWKTGSQMWTIRGPCSIRASRWLLALMFCPDFFHVNHDDCRGMVQD